MHLSLNRLTLQRGKFKLELDLNWSDSVLLLRGPSGAGKSLLLRLLAGLEKPDSGELRVDNQLWASPETFIPAHQRPISLMFQDYRLFPHLDVLANLCFAGASRAAAQDLAQTFDLLPLLKRRIANLSGGEKQRVALLRALLKPCRLLLLDEPLAALNPELRLVWIEKLQAFQNASDIQLVYVSHQHEEMELWPGAANLELEQGRVR